MKGRIDETPVTSLDDLVKAALDRRSVEFMYAGKLYHLPAAFVQNWPAIRIYHAIQKGMKVRNAQ